MWGNIRSEVTFQPYRSIKFLLSISFVIVYFLLNLSAKTVQIECRKLAFYRSEDCFANFICKDTNNCGIIAIFAPSFVIY